MLRCLFPAPSHGVSTESVRLWAHSGRGKKIPLYFCAGYRELEASSLSGTASKDYFIIVLFNLFSYFMTRLHGAVVKSPSLEGFKIHVDLAPGGMG